MCVFPFLKSGESASQTAHHVVDGAIMNILKHSIFPIPTQLGKHTSGRSDILLNSTARVVSVCLSSFSFLVFLLLYLPRHASTI